MGISGMGSQERGEIDGQIKWGFTYCISTGFTLKGSSK